MTGWTAQRLPSNLPRAVLLGFTWCLGALALGALFSLTAFRFDPLALPIACAVGALALLTVNRPEVGIAAAFPLVMAGNLGATTGPPWLPGLVWAIFLFVLAALRDPRAEGAFLRMPRLGLALCGYLAASLVGFVLASDTTTALPVMRSLITGALLFYAIASLVHERRQVGWVLMGIAASAVTVGGLAVYQYLTGTLDVGFITDTGELVARATAGFGSPNTLAGFLLVLVPFTLAGALAYPRARVPCFLGLVIALLGIYVSFSRGALIALAFVPLVFLGARRALLVAPLLLVLIATVAPGLARERFGSLTAQGSEVATRVDFWRAAENIWAVHPVLGVGLGGFPEAYATSRIPGKAYLPTSLFEPPPHAHNLFLNLLAEQGLLGLVAFLILAVATARACSRLRRDGRGWLAAVGSAGLAMLAAGGLHNVFDMTLLEQPGIFFWALLGLISAATRIAGEGRTAAETAFDPGAEGRPDDDPPRG